MHKNIYLSVLLSLFIVQAFAAPQSTVPTQRWIAEATQDKDATLDILEQEFQKTTEGTKQTTSNLLKKASEIDENQLSEVLAKDLKREGLLMGIIGALTLLYNATSDALLYPIFSFLFFIQTILLILLSIQLVKKYKQGDIWGHKRLLFITGMFVLIYFDLFLVVYEQRKVLLLGISLQKDIILMLIAAFFGFLRGKYASKEKFEEEVMP